MSHPLAYGLTGVVALGSLALGALGLRAYRRSGDRRLLLVASAFLLFFAKNALVAYDLSMDHPLFGHERLEMVSAIFDVGVVGLLIAPFLTRS